MEQHSLYMTTCQSKGKSDHYCTLYLLDHKLIEGKKWSLPSMSVISWSIGGTIEVKILGRSIDSLICQSDIITCLINQLTNEGLIWVLVGFIQNLVLFVIFIRCKQFFETIVRPFVVRSSETIIGLSNRSPRNREIDRLAIGEQA
jgi:hypothetical protein